MELAKKFSVIGVAVFCFIISQVKNVSAYTGHVDAQGNCYFYYKTGPSQFYAGVASNVNDFNVTAGPPVTATYVTMGSYTNSQWDVQYRGWKWNGSSWSPAGLQVGPMRVKDEDYQAMNNFVGAAAIPQPANTLWPTGPPAGSCVAPNPCEPKQGTVNYNLESHLESVTPSTAARCYDGCRQSVEIMWEDCLNESCVSSMKYTYTGEQCTNEAQLADVDSEPPNRCNEQLDQKIASCGGTLNVQSFDFETCTGVCAPDDCHSAWLAKVNECGGIMAVTSWSSDTCTGVCASDPVPNSENPPDGVSPKTVETNTTENSDGTSTVTTTTIYNYLGTNYTETKIITYDSQGNQINTTTSITQNGTESGDSTEILGAIRDKLEEYGNQTPPDLPPQPEYDGTIPDTKNWTEYDNAQEVGVAKANREIAIIEQQTTEDPFSITLDTSGSTPYLHGPMFGKEIYIRFDRPWMITGYQIMNTILIGIGYLQAALMVHKAVTGV